MNLSCPVSNRVSLAEELLLSAPDRARRGEQLLSSLSAPLFNEPSENLIQRHMPKCGLEWHWSCVSHDFLKKAENEPLCKEHPKLKVLRWLGLHTKFTETKDYFVIGEMEVND